MPKPIEGAAGAPRSSRRLLAALPALLAALCLAAPAAADFPIGLLLTGERGATPALSRATDVRIEVNGLIARTRLSQTFVNQTDEWVEGRYVFPLPDGAVVDELRIELGGRVIEGVVRERKAALQTFERARDSGRSAGLVERYRGNLFSTRLTNIAPGETVEVAIGFGQQVSYRHGEFRLRFPTATLPRYENSAKAAIDHRDIEPDSAAATTDSPLPPMPLDRGGESRLNLEVALHAGFEIAAIDSLHHAVRIRGRGSERSIELAPDPEPGRDFELVWRAVASDEVRGAMYVEQMDGRAHALLMLLPPEDFRRVELKRELIVVLDRSGSMQGEAFEQARDAVRLAVKRLDGRDRLNVVTFNGRSRSAFRTPIPATPNAVEAAVEFIDALEASGGTEFDAALELTLDDPPTPGYLRQLVFVTDGAVANESAVLERVERGLGDARLFAVGIGHGVNIAFLGRLAEAGRGTLTRIADPRDVADRIGELLLQLESPVLENLNVEWPPGVEAWPERLPDLYVGEPLLVHARFDAPASTLGNRRLRLTGTRDLSFIDLEWPLSRFHFADGVGKRWAQARIQGLERRDAMDPQLRHDEMLLTALDYGIVTSLTSLSAVDRTPRRSMDAALKRTEVAGTAPADRSAAILAMPATDAGSIEAGLRGLSILTIVLLLVFNRRLREREQAERRDERPGAMR